MAVAGGAPPATKLTEAPGSRFIWAVCRSVHVAGTTCRKASHTLGCKPPEALLGLWDSQSSAWFGTDRGNSGGGAELTTDLGFSSATRRLTTSLHSFTSAYPEKRKPRPSRLPKEVPEQFPPTRRFDQFERTATATPVRGPVGEAGNVEGIDSPRGNGGCLETLRRVQGSPRT